MWTEFVAVILQISYDIYRGVRKIKKGGNLYDNINDAEAHAGTSFVPFLGFMVFLIGLVFCFIGIVKINDAKKQWYLFYDNRDKDDRKQPKYAKEKKTGIIFVVIGVVCMIASFIIMR